MKHAAPSRGIWGGATVSRGGRHAAATPVGGRVGTAAAVLLVTTGVAATTSAGSAAAPVLPSAAAPAPTAASPAPTAAVAARTVLPRADRDRPPSTGVGPVPAPAAPTPAPPPPPPPAPVLPGCTDDVLARAEQVEAGGYANGRLPDDVLCPAVGSVDERLRADAALALVPLAEAYRQRFGESICTTDGYRPLAEQRVLRTTRRKYAAPVGSSNHGWGTAIDVSCGVNSFRSERHAWMVANAPRYGWILPEWAQPGGSRPEPWHWEYVGR